MQKIFKYLIYIILCLLFLFLIYSVFRSGYRYAFDNDELSHAQQTYLMIKGYKPYISFFTIYSPVFHWFLMPLFSFAGFSFTTISLARLFMIFLFVVRIIFSVSLAYFLLGKRIALIFLGLLLLDPFNVFTAMQVRPDNLMMTVFVCGLLVLFYALVFNRLQTTFFSGILLGLSLIISIKIAPSILAVVLLVTVFHYSKNGFKTIAWFVSGIALIVVVFMLYFIFNHSFTSMVQQLVIDSKTTNDSLLNPVHLGFFYQPNNAFIYGVAGKPLGWYLSLSLPIMAFFGFIITTLAILRKKYLRHSIISMTILTSIFIIQVLSLFLIHSVFIQYYIPILWLQALFAAIFIHHALHFCETHFKRKLIFQSLLSVVFIVFAVSSYRANISRSQISDFGVPSKISMEWQQIPEQTATFPNLLFRPLAYPLTYGYFIGDIPSNILNRFPPITTVLENKKVQYLLINSYVMSYFSPSVQSYIVKHYQKTSFNDELWIRN